MYFIKKIFNPEIFQGKYKSNNYFEGWYYKLIDKSMNTVFAIIPGISYGQTQNDSHAFIQVIDGVNCSVNYFKYDISQFKFSQDNFEITIGDNIFNKNHIKLNLNDNNIVISGTLYFNNIVSFPKSLFNPGIMGPFSFIPFMECYHGIVNIHHDINGMLYVNDKSLDFTNGYGYIEKDWGHSFPNSWIWMQSNHFDKQEISLMFSIANIPWLGKHFIGFISFLRIKDKIYKFATYTNARIKKLHNENNNIDILIEDNNYSLRIVATQSNGGILKAPKNGLMNRDIIESITSTVNVKLYSKNDDLIFEGIGNNTGLEIAGDITQFIK